MKRTEGFTLIEAAIAACVVAILAAIAVPSFRAYYRTAVATEATTAIYDTWSAATRVALVASADVVICPGNSGGCHATTDWSEGWIAFIDINGDRMHGGGESIVRTVSALRGGVRVLSTSGRQKLLIKPNGSSAGSNVTFTLCDGRGSAHSQSVVIANDGRMRLGISPPSAGARCSA